MNDPKIRYAHLVPRRDLEGLWEAIQKWRNENSVTCAESLYQVDSINGALPELAEAALSIIGYAAPEDT